jgi:hypothetical protein
LLHPPRSILSGELTLTMSALMHDKHYWMKVGALICIALASPPAVRFLMQLRIRQLSLKRAHVSLSALSMVKDSARFVAENSSHVVISKVAIQAFVQRLTEAELCSMIAPQSFDASLHFVDGTWRTAQYFLIVDALNFCFWPGTD